MEEAGIIGIEPMPRLFSFGPHLFIYIVDAAGSLSGAAGERFGSSAPPEMSQLLIGECIILCASFFGRKRCRTVLHVVLPVSDTSQAKRSVDLPTYCRYLQKLAVWYQLCCIGCGAEIQYSSGKLSLVYLVEVSMLP